MNLKDEKHLTPDELLALATDFIRREGEAEGVLSLILPGRLASVFEIVEESSRNGHLGWLIAGDTPFLIFRNEELASAEEALVLYVWYLYQWMIVRGSGQEDGDWPEFVWPGSWEPMKMSMELVEWLNPRCTYLRLKVLPQIVSRVRHPEILQRLRDSFGILTPGPLGRNDVAE